MAADPPERPVIPEGAKLEKLWDKGTFTEGPAYGPGGLVYFTDIGNAIMKFDPATGKTTAFRQPSGRANGLDFDPQGRLVALAAFIAALLFSALLLLRLSNANTSVGLVFQPTPAPPPITIDNAHQLAQSAVLGYGYATDVAWSPANDRLRLRTGG